MHVRGAVIRPVTVAGSAAAGIAVELVALVVLAGVARAGLGPAGSGWDTGGFRAAALLGGIVVCLGAAGAGAFAAARVALRSAGEAREQALLIAAVAPGGFLALIFVVAALAGDAAGAALVLAVAAVAGAALGATLGVRWGRSA